MVPFAGYELPVLYKAENGGVMKEHLWCRDEGKAAMFDVSHMGQVRKNIGAIRDRRNLYDNHLKKLIISFCMFHFVLCVYFTLCQHFY